MQLELGREGMAPSQVVRCSGMAGFAHPKDWDRDFASVLVASLLVEFIQVASIQAGGIRAALRIALLLLAG